MVIGAWMTPVNAQDANLISLLDGMAQDPAPRTQGLVQDIDVIFVKRSVLATLTNLIRVSP